MEKDQSSMTRYVLKYGEILGLFWVVKYLVFIGISHVEYLVYLYHVLNACLFLILYLFYIRFRDSVPEKQKPQSQCILFIVAVCALASVFELVMVSIHYYILDPNYFALNIEPILVATIESFPYPDEASRAQSLALVSNKIIFIGSGVVRNVVLGGVMGGILALIVGKRKFK